MTGMTNGGRGSGGGGLHAELLLGELDELGGLEDGQLTDGLDELRGRHFGGAHFISPLSTAP